MKILNTLESEAFAAAHEPRGAYEGTEKYDSEEVRKGARKELLSIQYEAFDLLLRILNPITPHICHALWHHLGHAEPIIMQAWPQADAGALQKDSVTLAVQINGKLRGQIDVAVSAPREDVERAALAEPGVAKFLEGANVKKIVVVPGKIVNIVVG